MRGDEVRLRRVVRNLVRRHNRALEHIAELEHDLGLDMNAMEEVFPKLHPYRHKFRWQKEGEALIVGEEIPLYSVYAASSSNYSQLLGR